MNRRWLVVISALLLSLSGCFYNVRERADEAVCTLAIKPYDQQPTSTSESKPKTPVTSSSTEKKSEAPSLPPVDVQTTALTASGVDAPSVTSPDDQPPEKKKKSLVPPVPPEIPGSEVPRLPGKATSEELQKIYSKLPPLPEAPVPKPGPDGKPYTLTVLQQIAATKSPTLHAAAFAVETARGNLIQARAYPNPTVGWNVQPSNDGSTAGVQGPFIDQKIMTSGKLKKAAAAAEMDLANAELALRRARSDLATQVRNAYFAVLVAKETVRVNKALAQFTDQIYILQATGLLPGAVSAPYEPAALQAQAYTVRVAYMQSIQAYIFAWEQLVAAIGLRHLPLSEVAGRVDAFIPYFDYDAVRAYVLRNHTDVLTARNGIEKARYNLQLARVTPVPDFDFNVSVLKEYSLPPKQFVHTATIGFPFPIWDRNRGGIIAAEGALGSALEEPHRVEEALTTTLATAFMGYKQNLDALENYRKYILPNQVRFYRGVLDRRQIDLAGVAFADLVTAQQTLATDVSNYLGILGSLWTSVVAVADLLQTDDLFQLGQPRPLPALLDLESLPQWPCCHECPPDGTGDFKGSCNSVPLSGGRYSQSSAPPENSRMARPEQNAKGATSTSTRIEDSGRANLATNELKQNKGDSLPDLDPKQAGAPSEDQLPRRMSEHVLTGKSRRPIYIDDHSLEEPPPIPFVPSKQTAEDLNRN